MAAADRVRERMALAVCLAAVAGFVDAVGYLTLDLFTAHMSGNSTRLGVYLGRGAYLRAGPAAFAVGVFVLSIAAGTLAMEVATRARLRSPAGLVLAVEVLLLAGFAVLVHVDGGGRTVPVSTTAAYYAPAALAVGAMGLQTSTLQRVSGRTVRTTFVSGMLTNLSDELVNLLLGGAHEPARAADSFLRDELGLRSERQSRVRTLLTAGIWLLYVAGGAAGAYLHRQWGLRCLALPIGLLVAVVVVDVSRPTDAAGR